ncbi:hypothetical protein SNEBB_006432 [Seison nebaliae]|nr:hypothetical protein SNEBB_006432 [Seison nebaliae]
MRFELIPIIPRKYVGDVGRLVGRVGEVVDTKELNNIIQYLQKNKQFSIPQGLQRINKTQVGHILLLIGMGKCDIPDVISSKIISIVQRSIPNPADIFTQMQEERARMLWPIRSKINYQNNDFNQILNNSYFSSERLIEIERNLMKLMKFPKDNVLLVMDKKTNEEILFERNERKNCCMKLRNNSVNHFAQIDHPIKRWMGECCKRNRTLFNGHLCTSCDVYVSDEPCMMCGMMLIHCRIEHLFFFNSHSNGAIHFPSFHSTNSHQIHLIPQLNHHFYSFHVIRKF